MGFLLQVLSFLLQAPSIVDSGLTKDMNLFLQVLSFLLQAVSLQCLYKTELIIEKTQLHLRSCLFLQALSFLLQVVSFVRPESTIDRACNRKDTTCKRKATACNTTFSCLFYYKLCLLRILASQKTKLAKERHSL